MRAHLIVASAVVCLVGFGCCLWAVQLVGAKTLDSYSHGEMICPEGTDAPRLLLRLGKSSQCEGQLSYPHLEVEIREQPIVAHKAFTLGPDNQAFRCADPKESCKQFMSGEIVFDHFEEGKESQTDGNYDFKSRTGEESGHFKVDCWPPCA